MDEATIEERIARLRARDKWLHPWRHALIATCTCLESMRTPFLPDHGEPDYTPYPETPPALIAWCVAHEQAHEGEMTEWYGDKPHRCAIFHSVWQEGMGIGNWFDTDHGPVLWNLGPTWTTYEATHPGGLHTLNARW